MSESSESTAYGLAAGSLSGMGPESVQGCSDQEIPARCCEVCCRLPFVEAPVWRKLIVPKEGLCQVRHGRDLVEFVDGILGTVVVDDECRKGETAHSEHLRSAEEATKQGATVGSRVPPTMDKPMEADHQRDHAEAKVL